MLSLKYRYIVEAHNQLSDAIIMRQELLQEDPRNSQGVYLTARFPSRKVAFFWSCVGLVDGLGSSAYVTIADEYVDNHHSL